MREAYIKPKAIIVAVSREYGVDMVDIYNYSIDKRKFKVFLDKLRGKFPFDNILIVMDNLSLHFSNEVRERMDELGFKYTNTPVYSPEFNGGVESTIGLAKKLIKQKRLEAIMKNEEIDLEETIKESFSEIEPHYVAKCVSKSL